MSLLPPSACSVSVLLTPDIRLYDLNLILLKTKKYRTVRLKQHSFDDIPTRKSTSARSSHDTPVTAAVSFFFREG